MITTIIFDLSEVYLHGMWEIEVIIEKAINRDVPRDVLYLTDEAQQFHLGQITEETFWQAMIQRYSWPISVTELKKLMRGHMTEIEGTREIIEQLKINGYRLGLLSVHGKEWIEYCEQQFDYHKLFHSVMYSFEVNVCKPDPKAFELILEKLGVAAKECLFIDDSATNISAAQHLGIQTIQFENPTQLKTALPKLGIKI
jgi:epoxide hydrolase-like predicted phosphatase